MIFDVGIIVVRSSAAALQLSTRIGHVAWSPIHAGSVFGLYVVPYVEIDVDGLYFDGSPRKQLFLYFSSPMSQSLLRMEWQTL